MRSARTRPVRVWRGRPHRCGVVWKVIGWKRDLIQYHNDSVEHKTSPARRDVKRQVVVSSVFHSVGGPDLSAFRAALPAELSFSDPFTVDSREGH